MIRFVLLYGSYVKDYIFETIKQAWQVDYTGTKYMYDDVILFFFFTSPVNF